MEDYNIRVLSTKSFNKTVTTCTLLQGGLPFSISLIEQQEDANSTKSVGINNKVIVNSSSLVSLNSYFKDNPVLNKVCFSAKSTLPLKDILNFSTSNAKEEDLEDISEHTDSFSSSWDYISDSAIQDELRSIALTAFNLVNPITKELDINKEDYYTHLIPLMVLTGVIPPQVDEQNNIYFNPKGVLSRAEFIDMLYAIEKGVSNTTTGSMSLDKLVRPDDFFSAGYNSLLKDYSSPLYRLYSRVELMSPITRAELAYIVVLCWSKFTKNNSIVGGKFSYGVNVDWLNAESYMSRFTDIEKLRLEKLNVVGDCLPKGTLELYISNYKKDENMTAYIESIKSGKRLLPLPWFCSLIELDALGVFKFNEILEPLSEVSRGEATYVLTQIARYFFKDK